jgi:hypothetical protein
LYLSAHKNNGNISVIIKTSTNKLKELNAWTKYNTNKN